MRIDSYPRFLDAMRSIGVPMSISHAPVNGKRPTANRDHAMLRPDQAAQLTLDELLKRYAKEMALDLAVVETRDGSDATLTWQELFDRVEHMATLLLGLDVQPGESVAYQLAEYARLRRRLAGDTADRRRLLPLMPIFREREWRSVCAARARGYCPAGRSAGTPPGPRNRLDSFRGVDLERRSSPSLEHVIISMSGRQSRAFPSPTLLRFRALASPSRNDRSGQSRREGCSTIGGAPIRRAAPFHVRHVGRTERRASSQRRADASRSDGSGASRTYADDRIFVPSPLAHQTGFLYGMWLAIVMGVPQIVQPVWNATRALRALNDWDGTFVQAATPFLADIVAAVDAGERPPAALRIFVATGAAVPRGLAERATRLLGTAVCGGWGTTEAALDRSPLPPTSPPKFGERTAAHCAEFRCELRTLRAASYRPGRGTFRK